MDLPASAKLIISRANRVCFWYKVIKRAVGGDWSKRQMFEVSNWCYEIRAAGKCHATYAANINIFSGVKVCSAFEWAAAFCRLHVTSFTVYSISCNRPFWRKRVSFCLSEFHFSITSSSSQTIVETRPSERKRKRIKDNGGSPELLETKEIIDFVERAILTAFQREYRGVSTEGRDSWNPRHFDICTEILHERCLTCSPGFFDTFVATIVPRKEFRTKFVKCLMRYLLIKFFLKPDSPARRLFQVA